MGWICSAYLLAVSLTIITMLYLAFFAWRHREFRGAVPFALAILATAETASMAGT